LNSRPLPHGQRSLRPSFSSSILPPFTIRTPRVTRVSEGNPRRRLLIVSKKGLVVIVTSCHGTPQFHRGTKSKVSPPGIEPGLRASRARVRIRHTPATLCCVQHPAEESNLVRQIRSLPCRPSHSQGVINRSVSRPGLEPGPGPSEGPMLSATQSGHVFV
jgi:hypothetical protein